MFKKINFFQIITLASLTVLLAGCPRVADDTIADGVDDSDNNGDTSDDLSNQEGTPIGDYISTVVTVDGEQYSLVEGTDISLGFENGRLSARAGCNGMGGAYSIEEGVLVVSEMDMTMMGCDEPRHEQDQWVFDILSSTPTLVKNGDTLTLTATLDDDSIVVLDLLDEDIAIPDLPFWGTLWTVSSIFKGDIASASNWENPATMTFKDDGTLDLFAGCNSGSGSYSLEGDVLTISGLGVTEMACDDSVAMDLENTVLDILYSDTALTVKIEQHRLQLTIGNEGLGLTGYED